MAYFLSTFANKIDKKGRVSVPASFRAALEKSGSGGIVLYQSFKHPCIEACGDERIAAIIESIDAIDSYSDEAESLQQILADSQQISVDGDGRMILPADLRDYANIKDTIAFVGIGKGFQLWEPDAYEAHRDRNRTRARERNATLKIIKPGPGGDA